MYSCCFHVSSPAPQIKILDALKWIDQAEAEMNELENNDHQNDSHGDIEQPPAPIKRTHSAVNDSTGSNQSRKKETNWPQRIEAVCAVLLVIITGFYTFYARKQLKAMQGQIAEMKNARAQSKLDNANAISAQQ